MTRSFINGKDHFIGEIGLGIDAGFGSIGLIWGVYGSYRGSNLFFVILCHCQKC